MSVDDRLRAIWKKYGPKAHIVREVITIDGDPVIDRHPTKAEAREVLRDDKPYVYRRERLCEATTRAYEDGLREGREYSIEPDLVTRRLLEGLQHVASHVHFHCKHGSDGLEGYQDPQDDEDALPTGRSVPVAAGSRLSRTAWRRCRKAPCASLVQIISDCRLWDALEYPPKPIQDEKNSG